MLDGLQADPHVGEIRQKGFMVGIELIEDRQAHRPFDPKRRMGAEFCMRLRDRGVILRPLGDTIVLMPPLVMGLDHLQQIVDAVKLELRNLA